MSAETPSPQGHEIQPPSIFQRFKNFVMFHAAGKREVHASIDRVTAQHPDFIMDDSQLQPPDADPAESSAPSHIPPSPEVFREAHVRGDWRTMIEALATVGRRADGNIRQQIDEMAAEAREEGKTEDEVRELVRELEKRSGLAARQRWHTTIAEEQPRHAQTERAGSKKELSHTSTTSTTSASTSRSRYESAFGARSPKNHHGAAFNNSSTTRASQSYRLGG